MAIFRKIHTSIWSDAFFSELDSEQKLFYLYLLTNERTKQCGVYEITKRQISFDLSYSIDTVSILLKYFTEKGKIKYNEETKEIGIANWLKFNSSSSPKVVSCINKEFADVKDTLLIQYVKSMGTPSQEEQEQEQEETQEQEQQQQDPISRVYKKFVDEVKSGGFDSRVDAMYMRLKLRTNTLTPLLKEYRLHIIEENRTHKDTNEFFINFKNWVNVQDRIGKLKSYKN